MGDLGSNTVTIEDVLAVSDGPVLVCEIAGRRVGIPYAYIEVGSAEVFRDESAAYASSIWAAGGSAELHVWAGGFHLYELVAADTAIGVASREARTNWVRRTLGL